MSVINQGVLKFGDDASTFANVMGTNPVMGGVENIEPYRLVTDGGQGTDRTGGTPGVSWFAGLGNQRNQPRGDVFAIATTGPVGFFRTLYGDGYAGGNDIFAVPASLDGPVAPNLNNPAQRAELSAVNVATDGENARGFFSRLANAMMAR